MLQVALMPSLNTNIKPYITWSMHGINWNLDNPWFAGIQPLTLWAYCRYEE